jgi:hypothetical protein
VADRLELLENTLSLYAGSGYYSYIEENDRQVAFEGYEWVGIERYEHEVTFVLKEKQAALITVEDSGERWLVTEKVERFWKIRTDEIWRYNILPFFFGGSWEEQVPVIRQFLTFPLTFRNYVSSVNIREKILYVRNGNILYVNSWENLDRLDKEEFIRTMGQRNTYDLYSNGLFFPINRKR